MQGWYDRVIGAVSNSNELPLEYADGDWDHVFDKLLPLVIPLFLNDHIVEKCSDLVLIQELIDADEDDDKNVRDSLLRHQLVVAKNRKLYEDA